MIVYTSADDRLQIARDYAHVYPDPEKGLFALARRLKAFGGESEDHLDAVCLWADLCRIVYDDELKDDWLDAWESVRWIDTGRDTFEEMTDASEKEPISLPVHLRPRSPEYAKVYSLAYHLAVRNAPHPFILPLSRLAAWLKVDKARASRYVRWLERNRLITHVNPWQFPTAKNRKSKQYLLYSSDT